MMLFRAVTESPVVQLVLVRLCPMAIGDLKTRYGWGAQYVRESTASTYT